MKNVIISEGDPTGINYEILNKISGSLIRLSASRPVIFISSQKTFIPSGFRELKNLPEENQQAPPGLHFHVTPALSNSEEKKLKLGFPSIYSGRCSYESFKRAMSLQKKIGGDMLTLPLSKEWVKKSGIKKFSGHTEELASFFKKDTFMLMYGRTMKVIPLTTHIPLRNVSRYLKKIHVDSLISAIKNTNLLQSPEISFCGVNPHAGEGGRIGTEEIEILQPIINKMKRSHLKVHGPFSADSLFTGSIRKKFDLIIACYHDQGLIPFKSIEGKTGVNVTLGLDFLRVSPDHGTAFDIAGKGIADPGSLLECIKVLENYKN
ncbi:MAG: 4-hydroxythreonine-4-phosphate dehydrogenase PdxA [Leptospira sp.]|nr:4-hydroxythreonine-4-phosphate dehydrogenase PdxA [Leptospira sp.]